VTAVWRLDQLLEADDPGSAIACSPVPFHIVTKWCRVNERPSGQPTVIIRESRSCRFRVRY